MSYTKDMRRDRIKKTITYLSLLFWLCLLVACGQQEETTDDGVTYFHHSIADRNTQETQENSTETEKSEEFLIRFRKVSSCTGMRMEWNTGIITEQAPVFMTNTETGHL